MSHTDHPRPARRPDYGDRVPRHLERHTRRQRTRRAAVMAAVREALG